MAVQIVDTHEGLEAIASTSFATDSAQMNRTLLMIPIVKAATSTVASIALLVIFVACKGRSQEVGVTERWDLVEPTAMASDTAHGIANYDFGIKQDDESQHAVAGSRYGLEQLVDSSISIDARSQAQAVYYEWQVDRPAYRLDELKPRRVPGVSGTLDLMFVVDTNGFVDNASVEIVGSFDERLRDATLSVLPLMRFEPARNDGVRVRQFVQQRIRFL